MTKSDYVTKLDTISTKILLWKVVVASDMVR